MTAVLTTPEDIVNNALSRIGKTIRVGSLYEGSAPAKIALDIFGQARDDLLRVGDWGFARRDLTLTLLKSAPAAGYAVVSWSSTYPPLGWKYQYTYPADCLKVRAIKPAQIFIPDFDPQPAVFDTPNDNSYTPPRKVLVTNVGPTAILTYAAQVTDPATWEPSFVEAMIADLARKMAAALNPQTEQAEAIDEQVADARADVTQG